MKRKNQFIAYSLSILCIFLVWIIGAAIINAPLILPSPNSVFSVLLQLFPNANFWFAVGFTLLRCFSAFFISIVLGFLLGCLCGSCEFFNKFMEIPMAIIRTTPVIALILLALFWFKSGTVPIFVSVLMTLPIITNAVASGFLKDDEQLMAMGKTFNFSKKQIFFYIKFPQIKRNFLNSLTACFGLTWKVTVAGEVLSLPQNAVGEIMQKAQIHLETGEVFAITLFVIFLSFVLEKLLTFISKILVKKCC